MKSIDLLYSYVRYFCFVEGELGMPDLGLRDAIFI